MSYGVDAFTIHITRGAVQSRLALEVVIGRDWRFSSVHLLLWGLTRQLRKLHTRKKDSWSLWAFCLQNKVTHDRGSFLVQKMTRKVTHDPGSLFVNVLAPVWLGRARRTFAWVTCGSLSGVRLVGHFSSSSAPI